MVQRINSNFGVDCMDRININIKQLENKFLNNSADNRRVKENRSFEQILNNIQSKDEIKFSKHAIERMDIRDITLNKDEVNKLNHAIDKAEQKGVKEALILMGDTAFIASIKNRTIVTTVNKEQLKENVFTNIDGAVIV
jgi:flagellar operon protein